MLTVVLALTIVGRMLRVGPLVRSFSAKNCSLIRSNMVYGAKHLAVMSFLNHFHENYPLTFYKVVISDQICRLTDNAYHLLGVIVQCALPPD